VAVLHHEPPECRGSGSLVASAPLHTVPRGPHRSLANERRKALVRLEYLVRERGPLRKLTGTRPEPGILSGVRGAAGRANHQRRYLAG